MAGYLHFSFRKVFLFFLLLESFHTAFAQPLTEELNSKLQASDQKKLKKVLELYSKSIATEAEAKQILSSDKNSQNEKTTKMVHKKLTESAEYYRDANALRYEIYTDNIKQFWKHYKGEKQKLDFAKTLENSAQDLFKKAKEFRFSADKTHKFEEQATLIEQSKNLEKKSLEMLQKVLYAYLTWPIEYDNEWLTSTELNLPKPRRTEVRKELSVKAEKKDTTKTPIPKPKTESKETVKIAPSKTEKKDTTKIITIKPKTEPKEVAKTAEKTKPEAKETTKVPSIAKGDEDVSGNDSSLYTLIQVNEDQVDVFNDFIKKTYPANFEDYIINFDKINYSDVNAIRDAWYKYLFGRVPGDSTKLTVNEETTGVGIIVDTVKASKELIADNRIAKEKRQAAEDKEKQKAENKAKQKGTQKAGTTTPDDVTSDKNQEIKNKENQGKARKGEQIVDGTAAVSSPTAVSNQKIIRFKDVKKLSKGLFTYRVQIAACRLALDEQTLHDIYNGSENITELFEDNWFKYTIGEYTRFYPARKLRDQIRIPGAFVIAYLHSKRIKATPANKRMQGAQVASNMNPDSISFRVQIAASRKPLSMMFLIYISDSNIPIDVIKEEGWYKYSLLVGKNYRKAKNLMKRTGIPGAFVVAYYEKTKLDLQDAIKYINKEKNRVP